MSKAEIAEAPISVRAYARHRGVDEKTVRLAIEERRLVRSIVRHNGSRAIITTVADQEWWANTDPAKSHPRRSSSQPDDRRKCLDDDGYRRAILAERDARTRLLCLRLGVLEGRFVGVADVLRTAFSTARQLRDQLLALPDRLAGELAMEDEADRIRAILARELEDILDLAVNQRTPPPPAGAEADSRV